MAINAKPGEGGDFKDVSVGPHAAICYQIVDLGVQRKEWQGKVKFVNQVMITWEITDETMDDGRPFSISKFYTLSLNEKANLYADLVSWRGKGFSEEEKQCFDVTVLAGVPALLNIVEKNGKSRVGSIMPLPKSMDEGEQTNNTVIFEMDAYLAGDTAVYESLSDGIKNLINQSEDITNPVSQQAATDESDPTIPF